jgi:hypothetical protein
MQLGWLAPFEIQYNDVYNAGASESVPDVYRISTGYEPGEYLLIENRLPVLYDVGMWQPGGTLIWHIDDNVNTPFTGNRNRGFPGQVTVDSAEPIWPKNGKHYQVALLQADGLYELEKALNNGHIDDFWLLGSELGPGDDANPVFPNTDGYAFGQVVRTGVTIKSFSRSGTMISFEVTGLEDRPPTRAPEPLDPTPRETVPEPPERDVPPVRGGITDPLERDVPEGCIEYIAPDGSPSQSPECTESPQPTSKPETLALSSAPTSDLTEAAPDTPNPTEAAPDTPNPTDVENSTEQPTSFAQKTLQAVWPSAAAIFLMWKSLWG